MIRKITDYLIVEDSSKNNLQSEIKRLLLEGWQPHGGMLVVYTGGSATDNVTLSLTSLSSSGYRNNSYSFLQVMIKGEPLVVDKNILIEFLEEYGK
jgi:hypothetical protein